MMKAEQRELFGDPTPALEAGLFVDLVFDRPLDQSYSYAVLDELAGQVAVGKRVLAPFGKGERATVGYCIRVSTTPPSRSVKAIKQVLDEEALLTPELLRLTRWMADYYLCGWGQVLNAVIPGAVRRQAGKRATVLLEPVGDKELPPSPPALTNKQAVALLSLRRMGRPVEIKKLARSAGCGLGVVSGLVSKGYARRVRARVERWSAEPDIPDASDRPDIELNADQLRAWEGIEKSLSGGGFQCFLLHGVTGSGKTEVYLRAIEKMVSQGKQALVLVPEISLTPQTIQRFRGRYRDVAVLHSHLGSAERGGQWRRIAAGHAPVIVGARSAVFAPATRLGLVVIDEEHESSFKQETTPRYHARDVAIMRARMANIPVILGSATPSLESWHHAQNGMYQLLSLPSRVMDLPLPQVGLIDMRHENLSRGRFHAISPSLERAIREALRDGGQIILLLNRRGFSTHIHCPSCGHVSACRFCDIALTYHRTRQVLLCHSCGYEKDPESRCPNCDKASVLYQGLGTEKLQAEIEEKFPQTVVRRMDSDSMKKPGSHRQVLEAFRQGLVHVLLGTQMIAKGLDFPNVTLVGVINADIGVHIPDFRAAERTFQLLSQVAGRAGRGPRGGKVLIQTFNPAQPSIALAAKHDYQTFVSVETGHRELHQYPPFQRLVRIIVRSRDRAMAGLFADKLAAALNKMLPALARSAGSVVRVLGPAEAPVFRLKGYFRFHLQLQSASSAALHQVLRATLPRLKPPSGVEYTVDVDPLTML
jgi:primosomal protein N' (replication factor Y)